MIQFYCLSVTLNVISGMILIYGKLLSNKDNSENKGQVALFDNDVFRLVVGLLTGLVGIFKLFFVYSTNNNGIPVIGDLLPAFAGLVASFIILVDYYIKRSENAEISDSIKSVFLENKKYFGIACLLIAVIHFIFPGAIIL